MPAWTSSGTTISLPVLLLHTVLLYTAATSPDTGLDLPAPLMPATMRLSRSHPFKSVGSRGAVPAASSSVASMFRADKAGVYAAWLAAGVHESGSRR
jgi:hypothetical protein